MTSLGSSLGAIEATHVVPAERRVIGIDLSMTSTGIALVSNGNITTYTVKSKPDDGRLRSFLARSDAIADVIDSRVKFLGSDLIVIEGMAFAAKSKSLDKIHAHWWLTVKFLCEYVDQEPVVVTPTARAKYATGKGNASKDAVLAAVIKRYPQADIPGNDIADAVVFAAMGSRHLGRPLEESLPLLNLESMEAVKWA